jgi:hypothetical protein
MGGGFIRKPNQRFQFMHHDARNFRSRLVGDGIRLDIRVAVIDGRDWLGDY